MKRTVLSGLRAGLLGTAALLAVAAVSSTAAPRHALAAETGASVAMGVAPALMPMPASVQFPGGALTLSGGIEVVWDGASTPALTRAADRFRARIDALAGRVQPAPDRTSPPGAAAPVPVRISVGDDPDALTVHAKEGYRLSVTASGAALTADGPDGVIHGLATLAQLVQPGVSGPQLAFAEIQDAPRFPWRGIMIDTSRHFVSLDTLRRQIDTMEMVKLNVLHLHLSDGTGFRVESKALPELTEKGSHGQYYTQAELRGLVAYAADRGIRIVPEFDIPGHALALLLAHPELAAQSPVNPEPKNKNTAALDPTVPGTLKLVRKLYAEMGKIFPDAYFHAGGDEVDPKEWNNSPKIVAYMHEHGYATPQALQAAFTADVEKILADQGKIMVGWDEVSEAPIPKNVVVEAWRSSKFIASGTASGHPVIVSVGYYLDLLQPAGQHYAVDPYDPTAVGITQAQASKLLAAGGNPDLIHAFLIEPPPAPLTADQQKLVMGGEAPLWAELVTDEMLDARFWPRGAAIAERFWSPASVRDVDDMYRRLAVVDSELNIVGLQAQSNTHRMMARLSPSDTDPVAVLASAVVPLRNYRLNRYVGKNGNALDQMAEIASPDPAAAIRFNALAAQYAAGDRSVVPALTALLQVWKNNDAAFSRIATVHGLSDALPVSHDVAALATWGLAALAHKGAKAPAGSRDLLNWAMEQLDLSKDITAAFGPTQTPAAGLMIAIAPGVKAIVGQ